MKKISIVLVSMVYMLPGVLAVLAHTRVIEPFEKEISTEVVDSRYAAADSLQSQAEGSYLVMLDTQVKK